VNALRSHWGGYGYLRRPQLEAGRRRAAFKPGASSGRASAASGCGRTGVTCSRQLRRGIAPDFSTAAVEVVSCPERLPCFALREKREMCSLRWGCNVILPGQYYDAETGLSYNDLRDYDPAVGRYVESDPIGLKGGINTYVYVADLPTGSIDPSGSTIVCARRTGHTLPRKAESRPGALSASAPTCCFRLAGKKRGFCPRVNVPVGSL
jgi:RHS repeat-associated protein